MLLQNDLPSQTRPKIVVKEKSISRIIYTDDITHLVCDCYITTVHLIDKTTITVSKLLKYFEEELAPLGFVRANHNTLVNIHRIEAVRTFKGIKYIHIGSATIKVSRRKICLFKSILLVTHSQ